MLWVWSVVLLIYRFVVRVLQAIRRADERERERPGGLYEFISTAGLQTVATAHNVDTAVILGEYNFPELSDSGVPSSDIEG